MWKMRWFVNNVDEQRKIKMSNYIEREALLDALDKDDMLMSFEVRKTIIDAPSADVKPVLHGKWLSAGHDGWSYYIRCTACNSLFGDMNKFKYCPNCGAKMDKED